MKRMSLFCCVLVCVAAVAGASGPGIQDHGVRSTETILPTEGYDAAQASFEMELLHDKLVAARAEARIVELGELSHDEAAFLAGEQTSENRRYLVGVDRGIHAVVDLAEASEKIGAPGAVHTLVDGTMVWTASFRSPGATAVRAHLTDIDLPRGAELFAYGQLGDAFGPYTGSGSLGNSEVWTNTVAGDTLNLQLQIRGPVSDSQRHASYFVVDSVGHMGERFELANWQVSEAQTKTHCTDSAGPVNADCVMNAECGSVGPAGAAQSAVAAMLYRSGGGYYLCSGGLLSNDTGNPPPYFLTANHCISKGNEASSLETYWDHKAPCGTRSCDYGWAGGRTITGASILSTNRTSDYTLLQLASVPSGRAYLGWSSAAIANNNGAGLHRISHPAGSPQAYSTHTVNTSAGTCQSWPRGNWIYSRDTYGATEGGSSGSPVLNNSGQVVGQLSGGCGTNVNDSCDAVNNATVDGAFAAYFGNVSQWLDGGTSCSPSTEVCDGVDNDCDGLIDENNVCGGAGCTLGQIGDSCSDNSDCCSNKCRGRGGNKTCR